MLADVLSDVNDKDKTEFFNQIWKDFSGLVGRDVKREDVRKKLTEAQMKEMFGWTQDSSMAACCCL
jgi:hypothetical protein